MRWVSVAVVVAVLGAAGSAVGQSRRAQLVLEYQKRTGGAYIFEDEDVEMELSLRPGGAAELRVRGRSEWRWSEVSPTGTGRSNRWEGETDEVWTGTWRRERAARVIAFDRVVDEGTPRAVEVEWRCAPERALVGRRRRSVTRCETTRSLPWSWSRTPVPSYFRVPVRFGARTTVYATYSYVVREVLAPLSRARR